MHRPHIDSNFLFFFFLFLLYALRARADVGTAALYGPPYLPTACFGGVSSQFPPNNLFAAAGEGIWDNGASCGREYLVRCLSSAVPGACADDGLTIQVTVVDQADGLVNSWPSTLGTTLVLSRTAFAMIAGLSAAEINIEFIEQSSPLVISHTLCGLDGGFREFLCHGWDHIFSIQPVFFYYCSG